MTDGENESKRARTYLYIVGGAWIVTLLVTFLVSQTSIVENIDVKRLFNERTRNSIDYSMNFMESRWGRVCAQQVLVLNVIALPLSLIQFLAMYPMARNVSKSLAANYSLLRISSSFLICLAAAFIVYHLTLAVPAPVVDEIIRHGTGLMGMSSSECPAAEYWFYCISIAPLLLWGILVSGWAVLYRLTIEEWTGRP